MLSVGIFIEHSSEHSYMVLDAIESVSDDLDQADVALILTDQSSFRRVADGIVKYFTSNGFYGIIFTADRTFQDLEEELDYHDVETDKLMYLDLVAKTRGITTDRDDVELINSPTAFNDVSIGLRELITQVDEQSEDRFILMDSFTAYLLYGNLKDTGNFIKRTTDRARDHDYTYIMTAVRAQLDDETIEKLMTFCDTKIDLTEA